MERKKRIGLGLMSGTSMDGIDVVVAGISGQCTDIRLESIAHATFPYNDQVAARIRDISSGRSVNVHELAELDFAVGEAFAEAALRLVESIRLPIERIDFIASHGQTVHHHERSRGETASSMQLGEASVIAERLGACVVSDFRRADIAAGGEGAPLVPYADYVVFADATKTRVIHNIGGISNITVLPAGGALEDVGAFDTGPGNMMIDIAMRTLYREPFDRDGNIAAQGEVDRSMLKTLMEDPYFDVAPPKSTGHARFGETAVHRLLEAYPRSAPADVIATLTQFTVESVVKGYRRFVSAETPAKEWILCGGGVKNKTMRSRLEEALADIAFSTVDAYGIDSDAKEALAFVVLGHETLNGVPANVPSATGAKRRVVLGKITPYVKDGRRA